ncbi:MAG: RDD family protein [Halobacteriales archaeon]|nr:RDD family protein [Halobacteriales archaeon]
MSAPPATFQPVPPLPRQLPPRGFTFQVPPPVTASLGRRAVAYVLDFTMLAVLLAVLTVGAAVARLLQPGEVTPEALANALLPVLLLAVPIFLLYFTVLEGVWGRTLGKGALGLRVQRMDGLPPTLLDSFVRNLLRLLWGPSLLNVGILVLGNVVLILAGGEPVLDVLALVALAFLVVDLWLIHSTEMEQRLGDLAAGTIVVQA